MPLKLIDMGLEGLYAPYIRGKLLPVLRQELRPSLVAALILRLQLYDPAYLSQGEAKLLELQDPLYIDDILITVPSMAASRPLGGYQAFLLVVSDSPLGDSALCGNLPYPVLSHMMIIREQQGERESHGFLAISEAIAKARQIITLQMQQNKFTASAINDKTIIPI